jgi:predicted esterase
VDQRALGFKDDSLKNLQETTEEKWQFTSFAQLEGVVRRVEDPLEVILLLHGLGERGKRIFRKLLPYLPTHSLVIAPNGPFPIPRNKEGRMDYGHSWYFYDKFEAKYFINQDLAKYWLRDLVKIENPKNLPVTIIGFSQGGYLAPLAGSEIPQTKMVIGLACEFRTTLIHKKPPFDLIAIHGKDDEIISVTSAEAEISALKKLGIEVEMHLTNGAHEVSSEMGLIIKNLLESHGKRSL